MRAGGACARAMIRPGVYLRRAAGAHVLLSMLFAIAVLPQHRRIVRERRGLRPAGELCPVVRAHDGVIADGNTPACLPVRCVRL